MQRINPSENGNYYVIGAGYEYRLIQEDNDYNFKDMVSDYESESGCYIIGVFYSSYCAGELIKDHIKRDKNYVSPYIANESKTYYHTISSKDKKYTSKMRDKDMEELFLAYQSEKLEPSHGIVVKPSKIGDGVNVYEIGEILHELDYYYYAGSPNLESVVMVNGMKILEYIMDGESG